MREVIFSVPGIPKNGQWKLRWEEDGDHLVICGGKFIFDADMQTSETTTLFRPVGPKELDLIRHLGWAKFPPRLPDQPIFYPVMNEQYAIQIAKEWNVPASGSGYVTKFQVRTEYLKKFEIQNVGAEMHDELWVPAEELEEFNSNIVGLIEITQTFT
jgi:hypothetical protein